MKIEKALKISAIISLLLVSSICYVNTFVKMGKAEDTLPTVGPLVYVYPENITANVNETFTVAVVVYNLTSGQVADPFNSALKIKTGDLYGFDIQFSWDPTVIKYVNYTEPGTGILTGYTGYSHTNVTAPLEKYTNPISPSPYAGVLNGYGPSNRSVLEVKNIVNETGNMPDAKDSSVRAWFAFATQYPAKAFNGNGTLFVMTFSVLRISSCSLKIEDCWLSDKDGVVIGRSQGISSQWLNPPRDGYFVATGAPEADYAFTPSVAVVNKPVHFQANVYTNYSNIDKFCWNFGDGTTLNTTVPNVNHTYTSVPHNDIWNSSMIVVDVDGSTSSNVTRGVKIATTRDLALNSISVSPSVYVKPSVAVFVNANVKNQGNYSEGLFNENCTVTAYYNISAVDPQNLTSTLWRIAGAKNASVSKGDTKTVPIRFNSSDFEKTESYYYFFANLTGIPIGYESNMTNNAKLSTYALLYTNTTKHLPTISTFTFGYGTTTSLKNPVIKDENTSFNIIVRNDGNDLDTFTLNLYVNGSLLQTWQTSALNQSQTWTTSTPVAGSSTLKLWSNRFDYGYYNLTLRVNASDVEDVMTKFLTVIKTPSLTVDYNPHSPGVSEDVTFDATASTDGDPRGNITSYSWLIYAPNASLSGSPTWSIAYGSNNSITTYNFDSAGNWTVILMVIDSFGVSYSSARSATSAYRYVLAVNVGGSGGLPIEWIIVIAVLVVVLAAVIVVLLLRRRRSAVMPPTQ